jgi:membrane-bound ClpP family serine protease
VRCALTGVAIVLTGTVLLVFDVALGTTEALIAAGSMLLLVIGIAVLPSVLLRINGRR